MNIITYTYNEALMRGSENGPLLASFIDKVSALIIKCLRIKRMDVRINTEDWKRAANPPAIGIIIEIEAGKNAWRARDRNLLMNKLIKALKPLITKFEIKGTRRSFIRLQVSTINQEEI